MAKRATSEGVAVAWARTLELPAVATSLPALSTWPVLSGTVRGFVVVDGVVGSRVLGTAVRVPVISFSTWAAVPNSDQPQWGAANDMAEILWETQFARPFNPVRVRQGTTHRWALVQSVHGIQEPRRVPDVDESRAHFVTELALMWTEEPE